MLLCATNEFWKRSKIMPSRTAKSSTAARQKGKGVQSRDDSDEELDVPPAEINLNGQGGTPTNDAAALAPGEAADNRSLEEILGSIPPPPPPAMTNEPGAPRLMITHIVNQNFKSYAGEQILGPFHKRFSCIIGPNGSGKSNVIDSMLFVFGYRAQKIRSKKLSVLIHSSDQHQDIQSCTVEVHFQKIIDKEGDEYEVVPGSRFCVSRTAGKDNSSAYHISGRKATFREVGALLRSHGIDLDHNRFLILQGEVEQIAMMKPRGQSEHDEGMLEYLEDIIGSCRLKQPILTLCHRVEQLNEQRGEKLNRVKMVEKEKAALEGEKNVAVEFLTLENEIFQHRSYLCQYYVHDLQNKVTEKEAEKERIQEDTKELTEKNDKLAEQTKAKTQDLKDVETRLGELTQLIEGRRRSSPSWTCRTWRCLEELRGVPASSEKAISEATARRESLEEQRGREEEALQRVMESLKEETSGLQHDKETKEKELLELSKSVNETRSQMDVAQSELDIYLSRHTMALSQLKKAQETLQSTTATLRERRAAIAELQTSIPRAEKELRQDEQELEQLLQVDARAQGLVKDMRQKVEEAKSSLSSNRSRGKVLDALMQQKRSSKIPGILGRLGDLGAIDEKYDVAISSSCGSLDNILVDSIDTAQKCVNFLKTQNIGVATFIGLDKMKVWERSMGPVKDEAFRPAFYFALRDTLVAQSLEQATRLAFQRDKRWRVVTLQGQIIEQAGTMTGGGGRVMRGRMGASLGSEVTQEELDSMEGRLRNEVTQLQSCQERKLQLEERLQHLNNQLRSMRNTLQKYTASMQSLSEQERSLHRQKQMEKSLEAYRKDFEVAASRAGKVEAEVKRLHSLIVEINSHKLKAQQDKLDKISQELDACSSTITKAQVAIKTADRNLKKSEEAVSRLEGEIEQGRRPQRT
ncbi:hypothetical protein COCON_G00184440 [Conger conger]|uniref:SMC hinge domain-containing protein n=1 Tax=Conger conger TaxID=82655 RepID=A0A9Q1HRN7_CONCO|nr:hypothetical protein COCON_G00184440 [Conger conger]